jgi:hypothetical protein
MAMFSCLGYQQKTSGQKPLEIGPLLSMMVLCGLWLFTCKLWLNMRPGRATSIKWRIPDDKEEWTIFMFRASKVVAPACVN